MSLSVFCGRRRLPSTVLAFRSMFPWLLRLFPLTPYSSFQTLLWLPFLPSLFLRGTRISAFIFPLYLVSWWFQPPTSVFPFKLQCRAPDQNSCYKYTSDSDIQPFFFFSKSLLSCLLYLPSSAIKSTSSGALVTLTSLTTCSKLVLQPLFCCPIQGLHSRLPEAVGLLRLLRLVPSPPASKPRAHCSWFILRHKILKSCHDSFCFGLAVPWANSPQSPYPALSLSTFGSQLLEPIQNS